MNGRMNPLINNILFAIRKGHGDRILEFFTHADDDLFRIERNWVRRLDEEFTEEWRRRKSKPNPKRIEASIEPFKKRGVSSGG